MLVTLIKAMANTANNLIVFISSEYFYYFDVAKV